MAYSGISNTLPQYSSGTEPALDRYIKFYAAGTTTPILGATDASGGTLVDKFRIDNDGYPVNATNDHVIPHIDQVYKIAMFLTGDDADANNLNNAVWVIDNMEPVKTTDSFLDQFTETITLTDGQTQFTSTLSPDDVSVYVNGILADNGRLVKNFDYVYDIASTTYTLSQSYPEGSTITLVANEPTGDTSTDTDIVVFSNVAALEAQTGLSVGERVQTKGYYTNNDGGQADYLIVAGGTGTDDGGRYLDLAGGQQAELLYKAELSLTAFGAVGDFAANDSPAFTSASEFSELTGCKIVGDPEKEYLLQTQATIRHGVSFDLRSAKVRLDHTGDNNDSVFQMGNNTELKNISELSYRSTSATAFSTIGMIKIGEFYAEINGSPNAGDNSLDSTYWEVENIKVENVHGVTSFVTVNTDRKFTAVVEVVGGDNVTTDNISLDGLAGDGIPIRETSVVRTETGFDPNVRRQGFNLIINNTTGTNLRAHPENAVVYINGDRNTKVVNVHGQDCGQIFACNSSGDVSNQAPSLRGKNGVNILAENITGFDCKIYTGDTFSKLTAGVNIRFAEADLVTGDRSQCKVSGIHLASTQVAGDKLSKGIFINDAASGATTKTKRVIVENFEAGYFPEGLREDTDTEQTELSNGWLHHNDANGASLFGIHSTYNRLKVTNNNQSGLTDGNSFNGHGVSLQTLGATLNDCIFGDDTIAAGTETQLQQIQVTKNDTRATFNNCRIGNYKTGFSDLNLRGGITGTEIYLDERCKGQFRTISSDFPVAPDVAKVRAAIQGSTGNALSSYRCTTSQQATGHYRVTFNKDFANFNYNVCAVSKGGAVTDSNVDWDGNLVGQVDVYTKDAGGTLVDADVHVTIFGEYDSQV